MSSALQRFAAEALKQHAYKDMAGAQLRQFNAALGESKERAKAALDAAGADAVAVPLPEREGAVVYVTRVRRSTPGSMTLRRLEEFASRAPQHEDMQDLPALVREVEEEVRLAREKAVRAREAGEKRRAREETREQRERLREERERAKVERDALREAHKATKAAMQRRVRTVQRALREAAE
jgi:hypothetical protein